MDAIQLDFLSDGRSSRIGIAALLAGLCGTLFMVWNYHQESQKTLSQEMLVADIRSAGTPQPEVLPVHKDREQIALETGQAKTVILELNLPWKDLFEAIESYPKGDVAVLSIEPDARKGMVHISAEAKSLDSLIAYLAFMQKVPLFRDVELGTHQIQEQDPQQPVRFTLQATWGMRP